MHSELVILSPRLASSSTVNGNPATMVRMNVTGKFSVSAMKSGEEAEDVGV